MIYRVGTMLREEMRQMSAKGNMEFLSAHTHIPIEVLDRIIKTGMVAGHWVENFKFLRDAVVEVLAEVEIKGVKHAVWRRVK